MSVTEITQNYKGKFHESRCRSGARANEEFVADPDEFIQNYTAWLCPWRDLLVQDQIPFLSAKSVPAN